MDLQRARVAGVEVGREEGERGKRGPHPEPVPTVSVGDADFFPVLGRDSRTAGGG